MHSISLNLFVKYVLRFRNYFARCIFISVYQCDRLKNYLPQRFHWQFRESNYLIAYYDSDRPHFKVTEIETRVNIVSFVKSVFKDLTQKINILEVYEKTFKQGRSFTKGKQWVIIFLLFNPMGYSCQLNYLTAVKKLWKKLKKISNVPHVIHR